MSELDLVEQIRRDAQEGSRAADELMFHATTRTIGPSSSTDPDKAVRVTKPDAELFCDVRQTR